MRGQRRSGAFAGGDNRAWWSIPVGDGADKTEGDIELLIVLM